MKACREHSVWLLVTFFALVGAWMLFASVARDEGEESWRAKCRAGHGQVRQVAEHDTVVTDGGAGGVTITGLEYCYVTDLVVSQR